MLTKTRFRIAILLAVLFGFFAAAAAFAPWKAWLETRLVKMLESQGLQSVHLTLDHVGLTGLTIKDMTIGDNPPVTLSNFALDYSLSDLLNGQALGLSVSGLSFDMHKTGNAWIVGGFALQSAETGQAKPFYLPVSESFFGFNRAEMKDSVLRFSAEQWNVQIPLNAAWANDPEPRISARSLGPSYKYAAINLLADEISLEASLDANQKQWNGTWTARNIKVSGLDTEVPLLRGQGAMMAHANRIELEGRVEDSTQAYNAVFRLDYPLDAPDKATLKITETRVPWHGGAVKAQEIHVSLGSAAPQRIAMQLERISAAALMKQLTGEQASATGTLSGALPITIGTNGDISIHAGTLKADDPGTIALSPEAIPGDNAQITLLRDVLKNFYYSMLSIDVDSEKDGKIAVTMSLEGKNPDMHEGRPVKINVRLTGDVLSFVQQNMLSLTNPKKFLEQGAHAKP